MRVNRYNGSNDSEASDCERVYPALRACLNWIENVLGITLNEKLGFRAHLASGEVLCNFLNSLVPGAIKRINRTPVRAAATDNLSLFTNACEQKCDISKSKLFRIDDFEDLLDKRTESTQLNDKKFKCAERIAVSIFWLSKFANRDPRCKHLAKLDYAAFSGLLPKSLIQTSINKGYSFIPRLSLTTDSSQLSEVKRNSYSEDYPSVGRRFKRISLENHDVNANMGNKGSSSNQPNNSKSSLTTDTDVIKQTNNNGITNNSNMENDTDLQASLDDWRNRRRRISRAHATKVQSMEEMKIEEERKQQQAVKNRMREIQSLRGSITSPFIASTLRSPVATSPGMALLTGIGTNLFDFPDNDSMDDTKTPASPKPAEHISDKNDSSTPEPLVSTGNNLYDPEEYRQVRLCLQRRVKASESRWGMTIKAGGPSETSLLIVDRVKIGSSADLCDVCKGDVLVDLNGTAIQRESMRLDEVEALMDRLFDNSKTVSLVVLRNRSVGDKNSDDDPSDIDSASELLDDPVAKSDSVGFSPVEPVPFESPSAATTSTRLPRFTLPTSQVETGLSSVHHEATDFNVPTRQTVQSTHVDNSQLNAPIAAYPLCDNQTDAQVLPAEIGRACMDSPADETSSNRTDSRRQVKVVETEPSYLTVGKTSKESTKHVIIIRQPSLGVTESVRTITTSDSSNCEQKSAHNRQQEQQQQHSKFKAVSLLPPPPPPLPLTGTESPSIYNLMYVSLIQPTDDPHTQHTVSAGEVIQRQNTLPSPPPLHLIGTTEYVGSRNINDHQSVMNHRAKSSPSNIFIRHEKFQPTNVSEPVKQNTRQPYATIRDDSSLATPPPSPLYVEPKVTTQVNKKPNTEQTVSNTRHTDSNLSSHRRFCIPAPTTSVNQAPPQPPRIPGNKGIDPKNKCTVCMQELGTGDLMIIHAMSLYYHLTCFTCSQCGAPMSDGSSNTEVRIRAGRLYCQQCHLDRHKHKTVAQGDAKRLKSETQHHPATSPHRSITPIISSDPRQCSRTHFDVDLNHYTNL